MPDVGGVASFREARRRDLPAGPAIDARRVDEKVAGDIRRKAFRAHRHSAILESISIFPMSRVVAKTGWMLGVPTQPSLEAWQGGQQRRRRAAARSRGPGLRDATAEACKGSRIVAERIARSRVAPPRYARRHCSAVRERLWSATLRDRAISAQGVVTFVLVYIEYTASSAPSPAPK